MLLKKAFDRTRVFVCFEKALDSSTLVTIKYVFYCSRWARLIERSVLRLNKLCNSSSFYLQFTHDFVRHTKAIHRLCNLLIEIRIFLLISVWKSRHNISASRWHRISLQQMNCSWLEVCSTIPIHEQFRRRFPFNFLTSMQDSKSDEVLKVKVRDPCISELLYYVGDARKYFDAKVIEPRVIR